MLLSFLYWLLRRLLELFVLRMRSEREKEIESWSCATSCGYSSARSPGRSFGLLIGLCSRRSVGCCRGGRARRSW